MSHLRPVISGANLIMRGLVLVYGTLAVSFLNCRGCRSVWKTDRKKKKGRISSVLLSHVAYSFTCHWVMHYSWWKEMLILEWQWRAAYSLESSWQAVIRVTAAGCGSCASSLASGYLPQNSVDDLTSIWRAGEWYTLETACRSFYLSRWSDTSV